MAPFSGRDLRSRYNFVIFKLFFLFLIFLSVGKRFLAQFGAGWPHFQAEISVLAHPELPRASLCLQRSSGGLPGDFFQTASNERPLWARWRIKRIYRIKPIYWIKRKRCHRLLLGPSLPHAPGVRMTVVTQTPSNEIYPLYLYGY